MITPEMKTTALPRSALGLGRGSYAGIARFFDIVNGFFNRCRDVNGLVFSQGNGDTHVANNLAEIISSTPITAQSLCKADVDGVDSQA